VDVEPRDADLLDDVIFALRSCSAAAEACSRAMLAGEVEAAGESAW